MVGMENRFSLSSLVAFFVWCYGKFLVLVRSPASFWTEIARTQQVTVDYEFKVLIDVK